MRRVLPAALAVALAAAALLPAAAGAAPAIGASWATNLQGTSALLGAEVDPNGAATSVRFQYVDLATYEADQPNGFARAASTPVETLGAGSGDRRVTAHLSGLRPDTEYRFRVRAGEGAGAVSGGEGSFATTAGFGFLPGSAGFDAAVLQADGSPATKAGSHPDSMRLSVNFRLGGGFEGQPGVPFPDGDLRDLQIAMPTGLLLNPDALLVANRRDTMCSRALFSRPRNSPFQESLSGESCPDASQVGVVAVRSSHDGGSTRYFGVFMIEPRPGTAATLGFAPFGIPVELAVRVREGEPTLVFELDNFPQRLAFYGFDLTLWGTPWMPADGTNKPFPHDGERGDCLNEEDIEAPFGKPAEYRLETVGKNPPVTEIVYVKGTCSVGDPDTYPPKSLLTLPIACAGPIEWEARAASWQQPGVAVARAGSGAGIDQCNTTLTTASTRLTTDAAASPSGFDFVLDVNDGGGLRNPHGVIRPPIRRAVVSLPEGLTINPSLGAGLGVCTPEQLARERVDSAPGAGCPNESKIGDVTVEGMIGIEEPVGGALFLAQPHRNPYNSLIALYIVVKSPRRGIFATSSGKVVPDPATGRLTATFDELPQLAYTRFTLRFREGQRAAMVSPPACGSFATQVELTPWPADSPRVSNSASFAINRGEAGRPCPDGSLPPFAPRLLAGSLNPSAGSYSQFDLRMWRADADQQITSYSATLPPGLLGKLAGVARCPEAAIEAAKARSGTEEELAPACPAASRIGRTLAGYGVGSVLAWAPGGLYHAGPYNGSPLSVAAVTSAKVGPFDLGTVVVRSAIRVDPRSAQASIDAAGSDPIPHILAGIPMHLRDIRVYVDRPQFTINPTSCDPLRVLSRLTGAGRDPFSSADDSTALAGDRFQALGCSRLGFTPRLKMWLRGGTKRGQYPALRAVYTPGAGRANVKRVAVTLPRSIFLAQEHIGTVCTRERYAAATCPRGSIYGRARAVTPLLEEPLEGPVVLRPSDNPLPDLVADLRGGGVRIEVPARIGSRGGGLRGTFSGLPDAPVTRFTMNLFGGKRGVLVNADDLCDKRQHARAPMIAHNNQTAPLRPRLAVKCKVKKKKRAKHRRKGGRR